MYESIKALISGLFLVIFLAGCGAEEVAKTASSSKGDSTTNPVAPSSNFFYAVHVPIKGAYAYTHLNSTVRDNLIAPDYSKECKVNLDATDESDRHISCTTDVAEADLYVQGIKLEYNVPKSPKCAYLLKKAYFGYRYEASKLLDNGAEAHYVEISTTNGVFVGPAVYGRSSIAGTISTGAPDQDPRVYYDSGKSAVSCKYDYTAQGGPNCCDGQYILKVTNTDNTVSPPLVTSTETRSRFSGQLSNCLYGPGVDQGVKNAQGFPIYEVIPQELDSVTLASKVSLKPDSALAKVLNSGEAEISLFATAGTGSKTNHGIDTFPSPLSKVLKSNAYLANAVDQTDPADAPFRVINNDIENIPSLYTGECSMPSLSGFCPNTPTYFRYANPYYRYECMDAAGEVTASIRMIVREWDQIDNLRSRAVNNPDIAGEPNAVSNDDEERVPGPGEEKLPINDFYDLLNFVGATYDSYIGGKL